MSDVCESCEDFNSKEYKGYKPYVPAPRGYDWRDFHDWIISNGVRLNIVNGTCHMCDIRRTGCISKDTPRYYCHKDDGKSVQTTFDNWMVLKK